MVRLANVLVMPACASALVMEVEHRANPVRRVVTMLQTMEKKVKAEGDKERELFDKFMCYCKNSGGELAKSIADAGDAIPELGSNIEAAEQQLIQLKQDIKTAQTSRTDAKAAMSEATAIREKDAAAYAEESGEIQTNLDSMNKAIMALKMMGSAGSGASAFLQTSAAQTLKKFVLNVNSISDTDRNELTSFLADDMEMTTENIGEVAGILQQMADTMNTTLTEVMTKEETSIKAYDELIASKKEEVQVLTNTIEEKMPRIGEMGVELVQMKEQLSDTEESLLEDKKFTAELEKSCATKQKEWTIIQQTRNEEILAIQDTIKILNDDDALEMFKKTLPGASSFMQLDGPSRPMRTLALSLLQVAKDGMKSDRHRIDFIMLMIRGKKVGFEKVLKMIDNMVVLMQQEQTEDDNKKQYCETSIDQGEDKMKGLERTNDQLETAIAEAKESIGALKEEIATLGEGIKQLDKSVAEATEQRQEENSDHKTLMINNQAAKELLGFAKNRLNKFYNPKLYKPPAASFVQISMHRDADAPPPPPAGPSAYKKNSEGGNGVIAMIDSLIKELEKEMAESETEEKLAQEEYEELMKDSAAKRTSDTKSVAQKQAALSDAENIIVAKSDELSSIKKEIMATHEYMAQLHGECDWLLKYFDVRKEGRNTEIASLGRAKAVLSGADYSLLQTKSRRFLHQ